MADSSASPPVWVKERFRSLLSQNAIEDICRQVGHTSRRCLLSPAMTIWCCLEQVLRGNTSCDSVPLIAGLPVTGEAFCKARMRLPLKVFEELLKRFSAAVASDCDTAPTWQGHRVWHMDGTGISMPDTPELQRAFGQPGGQRPGCGFPVAHVMVLFHAATGHLQKLIAAPLRTHDMSLASQFHDQFRPGDVLVADRAFTSYAHLGMLAQCGVSAVFRVHQRTIVSFRKGRPSADETTPQPARKAGRSKKRGAKRPPSSRWVKWLGKLDQLVEYRKPAAKPQWMSDKDYQALPATMTVREIKYELKQRGHRSTTVTLVTTLLDANKYSAESLAELYRQRWSVETNIRYLKTQMGMDVLRSKTEDGIRKELTCYAIVYNLIRSEMVDESIQRGLPVERLGFTSALQRMRYRTPQSPPSLLTVLPDRPNRQEPRVRKRRPKNFPLMKRPRQQLKQTLTGKRLTP